MYTPNLSDKNTSSKIIEIFRNRMDIAGNLNSYTDCNKAREY
jgi:hypothetical protein